MPESPRIDPAALPLRDIHLPESVSWWPPAPGVWVLIALAALLLVLGVVWLAAWQRRNRVRREAREMLNALRKQWCGDPRPAQAAAALSELLRRVGISYYGRAGFGGLTGEDEIYCLNRLVDEALYHLSPELGDWLKQAPYRPEGAVDPAEIDRWLDEVGRWLRHLPPQTGRMRSCQP